jgi:hypothetical protein
MQLMQKIILKILAESYKYICLIYFNQPKLDFSRGDAYWKVSIIHKKIIAVTTK